MSGPILLVIRLLLTLALYAFLSLALFILWKDLKQQSKSLAAHPVPTLELIQQLDEVKLPQRFTQPDITIGRDVANDLSVDDKTVSARHARLAYRQGQWWVEDLHSTNGTYINGESVSTPLVLTGGDELRCGQVIFQVNIGN